MGGGLLGLLILRFCQRRFTSPRVSAFAVLFRKAADQLAGITLNH